MNSDEKVKRIVSDFKSQNTEQSVNSQTSQKSKMRTVFKTKNTLLHSSVSPEIRKLYYSLENQTQSSGFQRKTESNRSVKSQVIQSTALPVIQDEEPSLIALISEVFPADHPILTELLSENQTIEELVNSHPEYFWGLLNMLSCNDQVRSLMEDKSQLGRKYTTQYSQDFSGMKYTQDNVSLHRRAYDAFRSALPMSNPSTSYHKDYVSHSPQRTDNFKPAFIPDQRLQSFLSNYKATFCNWQPKYHGKIGPVSSNNVSLPFISRSSYQDNFQKFSSPKTESMKYQPMGPFNSNQKLLVKQTSNQSYFSSPKLEKKDSIIETPKIQHTKSFEGQYKSAFQRSFADQSDSKDFQERFFKSQLLQQMLQKSRKTRL